MQGASIHRKRCVTARLVTQMDGRPMALIFWQDAVPGGRSWSFHRISEKPNAIGRKPPVAIRIEGASCRGRWQSVGTQAAARRLSGQAARSAGRFFSPASNSTAIAHHHQCGSQISFLLLQRFQSVGVGDLDEPQLLTGAELSGEGQVGCDHVSDPGIATGRSAVGHQQQQLPVGRELQSSGHNSCRRKPTLFGAGQLQRWPAESVAHAI